MKFCEGDRLSFLNLWEVVVEIADEELMVEAELIDHAHEFLRGGAGTSGLSCLPSCEQFWKMEWSFSWFSLSASAKSCME